MRTRLIYLGAMLVLWSSCTSQSTNEDNSDENSVILSGSVSYPQNGLILVDEITPDGKLTPKDTITLNDDYSYSEPIQVNQAGIFRVNFYNQQFVTLILHKDDVQLRVDGNARNGFVEITGSTDYDKLKEYQELAGSFQSSPAVQELNTRFIQARNNNDQDGMTAIQQEYMDLEVENTQNLVAKIDDMGASLAALQVINSIDKNVHFEAYERLADRFKVAGMQENPFVAQFLGEVETMKKLAIGNVAPDIALPNPDGEIVKLSSLRGKYVLVDFWAKWCKPCRMENPNVVKAYNRFKDKGFEVYGVSLDRKKEDWVEAIEQDGLTWTHVSDLKFWQSEAAALYNVKSIPFSILLDKEGKIIAKNLRGPALHQKLEEVLGK